MRKTKPFLQIVFIAVFALTVIGVSTAFAAPRKRPQVTRDKDVMVLEYDFDQPEITTEGDFDFVTIDGFERYTKAGAPVIPVKPVEILVPPGMKIEKITSIAINTEQLPDTYRLSHGQKPRRRPPYGKKIEPATPTKPNPEIFSMTTFWPAKQHDLVTVQTNRGYNIAYVNLFPLQYSPKAGKIKMATKMRLTVRLVSTDSHHRVKPTRNLKKRLERKIDNPDTMESYDTYSAQAPLIQRKAASPLDSLAGPYKYIVLTNNSLAAISDTYSFQALCESKIARGITAGIVTTEWIYANYTGTDNADKIRNFMIDAYETWSTEYALLAGNKDIIPVRFFRDSNEDIPADLYYGCVDPPDCTFDNDGDGKYGESNDGPGGGEVDLTAEIFTGRAAVENATEVTNFVNKTLFYGTINDPYLDHALSGGGYLGFGGIQEFTKPFSEIISRGSDLYLGHHTYGFEDASIPNARNFDIVTLYDEDWWNDNRTPYYDSATAGGNDGVPWNWNSMGWDAVTELLPILNGEGGHTTPQLLYISDHGSAEWGMVRLKTTPTNEYNCDDLSKLHNTKPFFFYDDSCDLGHNDLPDCFAEVITTMEHGAFGCIVNSRSGWGAGGNSLDSPSTQLTREFFHSVLGKGIFELGRAHQDAKESSLWRLYSLGKIRYVYYDLILFGDPELRLRVTNDETPPCEYTCGDLNGQGVNVNLVDYALFANCWGENPFTNSDCICANLVEFDDKIIDLFDLYVLAELFLSSSEDYPPNCSTSITDPYAPTPDPMSFATPPYATGGTSIEMVATRATDVSGVEYYFTCTAGGGHDSGWQAGRTYEDTGLTPETEYTYTVTARDNSVAYNQTAASGPASATTPQENIVLPANGGNLDSFTSEYGSGWVAADLTNGVTNEAGWCSTYNPGDQEFVFSFSGGNNATLNQAVVHGGTGEGLYYSKDVEVWTSADGTSFTIAGSDTLLDENNDSVTIDLGDVVAKKIKLVVTSGYRSDYWELAEFVVNGTVIKISWQSERLGSLYYRSKL